MRLILTNYIASLKEDKELDVLIQDILRQFDIEIVFPPQRGRQYGVDIYAVGIDPLDNTRKVFLITVKKGNLDRNNWQNGPQSLRPSLEEITDVFARNNILTEHRELPIKIVIAHNGHNEPAIQQNFVAFTENHSDFQFTIWQLETLVNFVQEKLLNENVLSDSSKTLFRRALINLDDPNYDLRHYSELIDNMVSNLENTENAVKRNIKLIRKINMVNAITVSYCEDEDDMRQALKVSELTMSKLAGFYSENEHLLTEEYVAEFINAQFARSNLAGRYIEKIRPICQIKDGFSKYCFDSISYAHVTYEHLGFISLAGLEVIQLAELVESQNTEMSQKLLVCAFDYSGLVVNIFNHNGVVFSPLIDSYCIEINLAFMLLFKLGQNKNIRDLMIQYNSQMAHAKLFANVVPSFSNNFDSVYEQEHDFNKRSLNKRTSSTLLTILIEWTLILNDPKSYRAFVALKNKVFNNVDLVLWFPDKETEKLMYRQNAMSETGYTLSHIIPTDDYEAFRNITVADDEHNSVEKAFYFCRMGFWAIGLIAMRHYRTYIFPHYLRSLIKT